MAEKRGSIAFFPTYRPPVPLDIYSCPLEPPPNSKQDELHLTDAKLIPPKDRESYNYNAQVIPPPALKKLLNRPQLASLRIYRDADVDSGHLSGLIFVSERGQNQLETLHIALHLNNTTKVFSLADVFGITDFNGARMEDSGCFARDYLIYVSTKEPAQERRQPWTAVYRTNINTGKTDRITPKEQADLSPSVSPSGKMIAVASFQRNSKDDSGWHGEIEDLKTNIYVIDVEDPSKRKLVVKNGGWPTWGSDNVIFFHRNVSPDNAKPLWGVFRADISKSLAANSTLVTTDTPRVLPNEIDAENIDARTPAAIDENRVAVATIRKKSDINNIKLVREEAQYRHIEIFEYSATGRKVETKKLTQKITPKADHYNPFVIDTKRIGYHRCDTDVVESRGDIPRKFHKLESSYPEVGTFRVSGVFPTFSRDGSKLAFVDNEFKAVWVADKDSLRVVFKTKVNNFFSPVWNQNPDLDTLYVCVGTAFNFKGEVNISAIKNVSGGRQQRQTLTRGRSVNSTFPYNNAFPSTNPEGTKLVFRSTRDGGEKRYRNLYIMEDAEIGEYGNGKITRLTNGEWNDTHCQWSPRGDWIVFSSTRDKPKGDSIPEFDNGLDAGYFAVFLVKWNDPNVVVRVVGSGDDLGGHMNHPFFSPDGMSIVVTADLAGVSVDPVCLPLFVHSVRPYGDIFVVDIDPKDIKKNEDVNKFYRITHSRYEYSTATWTKFSTQDANAKWNLRLSDINEGCTPTCPYLHNGGGESCHMTGMLCIGKTCC